jgi:hypothetical protein
MNRRIPNGTYGGVGGRGLITPSYPIDNNGKFAYNIFIYLNAREGLYVEENAQKAI